MLDGATRRVLAAALRESCGAEVCGFLLVDIGAAPQFVRAANLHARGAFLIHPGERRRVAAMAAARGGRIGAIVHSHARSLELSVDDQRALLAGDLPWIVVALADGVLTSATYVAPGSRSVVELPAQIIAA
jgi:proteasome lid subunit RPN8/RPN11